MRLVTSEVATVARSVPAKRKGIERWTMKYSNSGGARDAPDYRTRPRWRGRSWARLFSCAQHMSDEQNPPHELEARASTVVLVGRFNPRILQPAWFDAKGLLAEEDVNPKTLVLTDGFVSFETQTVEVFCAQERCQVGTKELTPTPDVIRDLVSERSHCSVRRLSGSLESIMSPTFRPPCGDGTTSSLSLEIPRRRMSFCRTRNYSRSSYEAPAR